MSTFAVTAERLVIHNHPNADALELAQVGLYRAVVPKGVYQTGDYAIYIPEQAIVPADLLTELGLTGRLGGKEHNRVCAVRLRGEISQGIVCLPAVSDEWFSVGGPFAGGDLDWAASERIDFADLLRITKWIPTVPVNFAGEMEAAPDLLPWIDVENIKRYPNIFKPGEPVVATEKIHGSACLCTFDVATGAIMVSSKGLGAKQLALTASKANLYWNAVTDYRVDVFAANIASEFGATRVGVFGEVFGRGVQDLSYGTNPGCRPSYACFDVAIEVGGGGRWLAPDELIHLAAGFLPLVPQLYCGPYDESALIALAEGPETVTGTGVHIREGLVVRPAVERYSDVIGGRTIGKIVSDSYLIRKGGTEYE